MFATRSIAVRLSVTTPLFVIIAAIDTPLTCWRRSLTLPTDFAIFWNSFFSAAVALPSCILRLMTWIFSVPESFRVRKSPPPTALPS